MGSLMMKPCDICGHRVSADAFICLNCGGDPNTFINNANEKFDNKIKAEINKSLTRSSAILAEYKLKKEIEEENKAISKKDNPLTILIKRNLNSFFLQIVKELYGSSYCDASLFHYIVKNNLAKGMYDIPIFQYTEDHIGNKKKENKLKSECESLPPMNNELLELKKQLFKLKKEILQKQEDKYNEIMAELEGLYNEALNEKDKLSKAWLFKDKQKIRDLLEVLNSKAKDLFSVSNKRNELWYMKIDSIKSELKL